MLHYQQQQHEGHFAAYPPHLVDTQYMEVQTPGPDSVDELSGLARNQYFTPDQNQNQDQADQLQHELDTWRRNVQMAMPQQSDIISQALADASLSSPTAYSPWDREPPLPTTTTTGEHYAAPRPAFALMQSHAQAQGQYQQFYTNGAGCPENGAQHGYIPIYTHHQHTHQPPHSQALPHGAYPSSITSNTSGGPSSPMTEAEADLKRLRNTAASARFRAKKKQREASLERNSREKKEQLAKLEGRIHELEEENKFLKDLIMEKNDSREDLERLKGRYDVAGRKRKEGDARKDGVGT